MRKALLVLLGLPVLACTSILGDFEVGSAPGAAGPDASGADAFASEGGISGEGGPGDGGGETDGNGDDDDGGHPPRTGTFKWLFQAPELHDGAVFVGPDGKTTLVGISDKSPLTIGDVAVTRVAANGPELVVMQLDAAGALLWAQAYGESGFDGMTAPAVSVAGNTIVVAGSFSGPAPVEWDVPPKPDLLAPGNSEPTSFFLAIDAANATHPILWGRTTAYADVGRCTGLSAPVSGHVTVVCEQDSSVQVRGAPDSSKMLDAIIPPDGYTSSVVAATVELTDGLATDAEAIYGLNGDPTVTSGASGAVYVAASPYTWPYYYLRAATRSTGTAPPALAYSVTRLKAGGGEVWTKKWAIQGTTGMFPRLALDLLEQPWLEIPFSGTLTIVGDSVASTGLRDWAAVGFGPADGRVLGIRQFGGNADDLVYDIGFDNAGEMVLLGEGSGFSIDGLSVPTPTSAAGTQELVLAKTKTDGTVGVWVQTAPMARAATFDWSAIHLAVGPYNVIAGTAKTAITFSPTQSVSHGLFAAAFAP